MHSVSATSSTTARSIAPAIAPEPAPTTQLGPTIALHPPRTVFDGDCYSPIDPTFDIDGAAARVVAAYDRNGDGELDLSQRQRNPLGNEYSRVDGGTAWSIRALAFAADARGNGDGRTTVDEIANLMRFFDGAPANGHHWRYGDGMLSGQERTRFLAAYGEEDASWLDATGPGTTAAIPVVHADRTPFPGTRMPRPDFGDRVPYPQSRLQLLDEDYDVLGGDRPSLGATPEA